MFPESTGTVEATWFSGEIVSCDAIDPKDTPQIEMNRGNNWPVHFTHFALVIHKGKLLLEVVEDLETNSSHSRLTRHIDDLFPQTEIAFLRAIQAELGDFTAKLVYADWLEEQDDPRGPLLRGEAERQQKKRWQRLSAEDGDRWDLPSGFVPHDDMLWYWRWLADIPELTPEEQKYRRLIDELKPKG
jgi:uncharacterized protein (TIGR02996 family)